MTLGDLERPKRHSCRKKFYGAHQKYLNEDRPILSVAKNVERWFWFLEIWVLVHVYLVTLKMQFSHSDFPPLTLCAATDRACTMPSYRQRYSTDTDEYDIICQEPIIIIIIIYFSQSTWAYQSVSVLWTDRLEVTLIIRCYLLASLADSRLW